MSSLGCPAAVPACRLGTQQGQGQVQGRAWLTCHRPTQQCGLFGTCAQAGARCAQGGPVAVRASLCGRVTGHERNEASQAHLLGSVLAILLPRPRECWDYRQAPPHMGFSKAPLPVCLTPTSRLSCRDPAQQALHRPRSVVLGPGLRPPEVSPCPLQLRPLHLQEVSPGESVAFIRSPESYTSGPLSQLRLLTFHFSEAGRTGVPEAGRRHPSWPHHVAAPL